MKSAALLLAGSFLLAASLFAQESKRVPQGIREADKAESAFEKEVPPPQNTTHRALLDLHSDADELARLASSIPIDIQHLQQGLLPADLTEKLKKIERLSKRLRKELTP